MGGYNHHKGGNPGKKTSKNNMRNKHDQTAICKPWSEPMLKGKSPQSHRKKQRNLLLRRRSHALLPSASCRIRPLTPMGGNMATWQHGRWGYHGFGLPTHSFLMVEQKLEFTLRKNDIGIIYIDIDIWPQWGGIANSHNLSAHSW